MINRKINQNDEKAKNRQHFPRFNEMVIFKNKANKYNENGIAHLMINSQINQNEENAENRQQFARFNEDIALNASFIFLTPFVNVVIF